MPYVFVTYILFAYVLPITALTLILVFGHTVYMIIGNLVTSGIGKIKHIFNRL